MTTIFEKKIKEECVHQERVNLCLSSKLPQEGENLEGELYQMAILFKEI